MASTRFQNSLSVRTNSLNDHTIDLREVDHALDEAIFDEEDLEDKNEPMRLRTWNTKSLDTMIEVSEDGGEEQSELNTSSKLVETMLSPRQLENISTEQKVTILNRNEGKCF